MPHVHLDPGCRFRTPDGESLVWFVYGVAQLYTQSFLTSNPIMSLNGNWQSSFLREMLTSAIFKTPWNVEKSVEIVLSEMIETLYVYINKDRSSLKCFVCIVSPHPYNNLGVEFCHHYFKHETTVPYSKDVASEW